MCIRDSSLSLSLSLANKQKCPKGDTRCRQSRQPATRLVPSVCVIYSLKFLPFHSPPVLKSDLPVFMFAASPLGALTELSVFTWRWFLMHGLSSVLLFISGLSYFIICTLRWMKGREKNYFLRLFVGLYTGKSCLDLLPTDHLTRKYPFFLWRWIKGEAH